MRKIKEVLRLHYELGLGQHQIARCCSISQSTVHGYLKRAESFWILDQEAVRYGHFECVGPP